MGQRNGRETKPNKKKKWKQTDKQDKSEEQDKRQTDYRLSKKEERRQTTSITWTNFAITKPHLSLSLSLILPLPVSIEKCKKFVKVFVDLFIRFLFLFFPPCICVFCKLLIPLFHLLLSSLPTFGFVMQTTFVERWGRCGTGGQVLSHGFSYSPYKSKTFLKLYKTCAKLFHF